MQNISFDRFSTNQSAHTESNVQLPVIKHIYQIPVQSMKNTCLLLGCVTRHAFDTFQPKLFSLTVTEHYCVLL